MKFSFFLFFFSMCFAYGQPRGGVASTYRHDLSGFKGALRLIKNNKKNKIVGSVYLYEHWQSNGSITFKNNNSIKIDGLNYDTYNEAFVAKISNDSVYLFDSVNVKEAIINNEKYKNLKGTNNSFMQVLAVVENIEILKKIKKVVRSGKKDPLTQEVSDGRFIKKTTYYFSSYGSLKEFRLSKKSFSKLFGEKSKAIKYYISKNKLSLKEDKNFQLILNYYNTL